MSRTQGTPEIVLAGRPGAGKTLLWERLGVLLRARTPERGRVVLPGASGTDGRLAWPPPNTGTAALPAWVATAGRGLWERRVRVVDTPGLTDGPDPDPVRRRLQAAALERMACASGVLHVVDMSLLGRTGEEGLSEVDRALAALGASLGSYLVVATKMDLPWAQTGLAVARRALGAVRLVPVSARTGQGLAALRKLLWNGPWRAPQRGHRQPYGADGEGGGAPANPAGW